MSQSRSESTDRPTCPLCGESLTRIGEGANLPKHLNDGCDAASGGDSE